LVVALKSRIEVPQHHPPEAEDVEEAYIEFDRALAGERALAFSRQDPKDLPEKLADTTSSDFCHRIPLGCRTIFGQIVDGAEATAVDTSPFLGSDSQLHSPCNQRAPGEYTGRAREYLGGIHMLLAILALLAAADASV